VFVENLREYLIENTAEALDVCAVHRVYVYPTVVVVVSGRHKTDR
jgi:hypothetical protein